MEKPWKIILYILAAFIGAVFTLIVISIIPIPGNYKVLTVLSGSMEPAIRTGSIIFVKPIPINYYKVNDVITFSDSSISDDPVTHRIIEINEVNDEKFFKVKGDANSAADWNEVSKENITGKVLFSVPVLGYILSFAKQPLVFIILIWVPTIIIIWEEVQKIKREIKKGKSDKIVKEANSVPSVPKTIQDISIKKEGKEECSHQDPVKKRERRKR